MADDGPWNDYKTEQSPAGDTPWADYAPKAALPQWDAGTEAMNAAMLGGGPTVNGALAALTGGDYAATKQANQSAHEAYAAANPKTALAANVVGGLAPAAAATMAGAPVALAGGVMGAMPGVFAQDPTQTVMGGALGAGGAAAAGLLGKVAGGLFGKAAPTAPEIPTGPALKALGGQQADAMRATGAEIDPAAIRAAMSGVSSDLTQRGMTQASPTTTGLIRQTNALAPAAPAPNPMQAMTGVAPAAPSPVSIAQLDAMRAAFGNVQPSASTSPTDAAAAAQAKNAILDLYQQNPQIAQLSADARGNSHAGFMSQSLDNAAVNAENGAQATGTGKNIDNKYRQQATRLLDPNANRMAGFPQPVVDAVQTVNDGSRTQNILRDVATKLGGGGGPLSTGLGLATGSAAFGATGSPWASLIGALVPAVGAGAKVVENRMSARAMQAADEAARMSSPAYRQNAANFVPPVQGMGAQLGQALAPSIGAATANPGLGGLFGN